MSKSTFTLAALVASASFGCSGETTEKTEAPRFGGTISEPVALTRPLTYHADVRPLIEGRCATCHVEGGVGPYPLTTYAEVLAKKDLIRAAVASRRMPPYPALGGCNEYLDDWSLTDEQRSVITSWVDQGAPEGDAAAPGTALAPIVRELSRTDLSLSMPEPYTPKANADDYRCFVLDWPYPTASFVTGFGITPSNLAVAHHVIIYMVEPEAAPIVTALDAAEEGQGYTCFGGPGVLGRAAAVLGTWVPGAGAGDFPTDTGILVRPGAKLVMQMHYNTFGYGSSLHDGKGEPDQTTAQLKIDATVAKPGAFHWVVNPQWIVEPQSMLIPAGQERVVHSFALYPSLYSQDRPVEIHRIGLHQHVKGSRSKLTLVRENGSEQCLLDIPRWDFNWQLTYPLKTPVVANPNDAIRVDCEWSNAGEGAVDRTWGEGTFDEMCLGMMYVTY
jgi:hypothetical protein